MQRSRYSDVVRERYRAADGGTRTSGTRWSRGSFDEKSIVMTDIWYLWVVLLICGVLIGGGLCAGPACGGGPVEPHGANLGGGRGR